ncbi:bacteriophage abortive infection AbiH family protein [Prevotella herbatica]|uniref:Bacteriophage abortive infection AbiH family protein n=1 Tax=Prevotella herbatica TaxID=2801997 RepID=A0ABM7NUQ0_9BACT|nr:bacteriophage abortive infection AbiH family protein [Prevotella herbatica]BCS84113.1 bacteriophage abortive infection AbiH family protein [Prevotella herbatica]
MKHLYIIGNGFDRHHNMNTSYLQFREWLGEKRPDVLNNINQLFDYNDDEWWQEFESNLATAITSELVQNEVIDNYPDLGSDNFHDADWYDAEYAVENRLSEVYSDIREAFNQWVSELEMGDKGRKIKLITDDATYITFNYTATLETLYSIDEKKILHIHGKASTGDELVLGHGVSEKDIEDMLEKDYPTDKEEGDDYVTQRAKYAAIDGVYNQRKKTQDIINRHEDWFASLKDVTNLYFYGHSFGEVDDPYFRKILSVVNKNNVQIEVSDYNSDNKSSIDNFMKSEGIGTKQYTIVDLNDKLLKSSLNSSIN